MPAANIQNWGTETCPTLEDFGVNANLARIFRGSMAQLQRVLQSIKSVRNWNTEGGAVQWWMLHCGSLMIGAADAARVLITHNLAREVDSNQRHAFEIMVRAGYFQSNPAEALREIRTEPIKRLALAKHGRVKRDVLDKLERQANDMLAKYPELASFELPPLEQMLQTTSWKQRSKVYAQHYRMASDYSHVSELSFKRTIRHNADGTVHVSLDSREEQRTAYHATHVRHDRIQLVSHKVRESAP